MPPFVRPQLDSSDDPIRDFFADLGLERHATLIATLVRTAYGTEEGSGELDEYDEALLGYFAQQLRGHEEEPRELVGLRTVVLISSDMRRHHEAEKIVDLPSRLRELHEIVRGERHDLNDVVRVLFREKAGPATLKETGVAAALVVAELLDPRQFLDVEAIRSTEKHLGGASWNNWTRGRDPRLPEFWAALDPARTLRAVHDLLALEPIATLGSLAWGFERCLDLRYPGYSEHLYPLIAPLARLLERRFLHEGKPDDLVLARCCCSYGEHLDLHASSELGDDFAKLREHALTELGRMRTWIRLPIDDRVHRARQMFIEAAAFFVPRTSKSCLWDVLRRLLLGLRELPERAVAFDLRTWNEGGFETDPVPENWGWLPTLISNVLTLMLAREIREERDLDTLRRHFAEYCLDRLKTRAKVPEGASVALENLKEPSSEWRLGYIHAVRELHANLGERGHHVLGWCANHDPSEDVRAEAKRAHESVRRSHGLPANVSARRAVFTAFWCLRQAHVLALGEKVNEGAAQRTLRKEVRQQDKFDNNTANS